MLRTHEWAPRVLIANSNLVGDWATWPEFRRLEPLGLTMYGQMTAGSWIYIGTQGILQGTYETFAAVAAKRFGGYAGRHAHADRRLRRHGRRAAARGDHERRRLPDHRRRPDPAAPPASRTRYLDAVADSPGRRPSALALAAKRERRALSVGVVGNAATLVPELLRRGVEIDIVTDQTSAHDPLSLRARRASTWPTRRTTPATKPEEFTDRARASMARHVEAMVGFLDAGAEVFDYGNSIRGEAQLGGFERAFAFPGFVPAYIRPLFCEGKGPFRWAALSGDPADIAATDRADAGPVPGERVAGPLDPDGRRAGRVPGPAGPHLLARLRRARPGRPAVQRDGRRGRAAPRRSSSAATTSTAAASPRPYRETEAMRDGSDAIADWPLLNALVNTAQRRVLGVHPPRRRGRHRPVHPRRPGQRRRRHRRWPAQKLERVLTNDPGMGVIRHVDAGYDLGRQVARARRPHGVRDAR